jgi:hypothetical protein
MSTDLTVILEHRPGELARLGEITGEAGVSIRGLAAFTGEGRSVAHLLPDDQVVARCREALERAGIGIADQREVLVAGTKTSATRRVRFVRQYTATSSTRSSRDRLHGRPLRTGSAPSRRSALTSLPN